MADATQPKLPWYWLRDTTGSKSASLTFSTLALACVLLWMLVSMFEGFGKVAIRPWDATGCTALLGVVFGLYGARRWTQSKEDVAMAGAPAPGDQPPASAAGG